MIDSSIDSEVQQVMIFSNIRRAVSSVEMVEFRGFCVYGGKFLPSTDPNYEIPVDETAGTATVHLPSKTS